MSQTKNHLDGNHFSRSFVHRNPYSFAEPRDTCKILNTSQISQFLLAPESFCSN